MTERRYRGTNTAVEANNYMRSADTRHNLNDRARIKILPRGMEIIQVERDRLARQAPSMDWSKYWEPDAEGYLEMPLWEVANIFGAALYNGTELPFETEFTLRKS